MSEARSVSERPCVRVTACVRSLYTREMTVAMREHAAASPGVRVNVVECSLGVVTRRCVWREWRRRLRQWRDKCRVAAVVAIGTGPGLHGSVRWSVPCHVRDPRVHGCEGEARSGNARGGLADPADGQRPGWVVNSDWTGSLREHVCETLRDLHGVFCSQSARRRLRTGRAHVFAWRIPRIARFPAGGSNSLPDGAVHEGTRYTCSCMTSRARSSMRG